jgi:hypothetical protein
MSNEAGDKKLLGNFRKLIDQVSADPNYKPSNPTLSKAKLETQYTTAAAAVEEVSAKLAPHKLAITDRQTGYDGLPSIVTRSRNLLKASGVSKEIVADAETHVRKIVGRRATPKPKTAAGTPGTPDETPRASHSSAQTSFENQLGNFGAYLAVLSNVPAYKPNEPDLKLAGLQALSDDLHARNNNVSSAFAPLVQARGQRDQLLYLSDDSVVNTALLAKAYVKGALGTNSQLHKQIKGLTFSRQNKA